MGLLATLVLATPVFGFALSPPSLDAPSSVAAEVASPSALAAPALSALSNEGTSALTLELPASSPLSSGPLLATAAAGSELSQQEYVEKLRTRASIAKVHRTLGIATWAVTALAVGAGTVQYRNLYGFFDGRDDNPCVTGDAWFRQESCYGTPWAHAITGFTAGGLYFTTLGLAVAMPDPDNASEGKSKFAQTLRLHKTLRWVHLGGMLTQMVLGVLVANPKLGIDRANDYNLARNLATVHLVSGYVTFGALSWAGWLML